MQVNQQALAGLYTSFNTVFNKTLADHAPTWPQIAFLVNSTSGEENYKWLGDFPMLREWIGDRQIKNLAAYDYLVKNKDFEGTVSVPRNAIEDDQIGLYAPMVRGLAEAAAAHPNDLVFNLLMGGFANKCFDGKPFFSTAHMMGGKKNAVSNKGTAALTAESYAAARTAMMSLVSDENQPLKIVPDLLVVPPALEGMGRKILLADQIEGSTNVYKDTAKLMVAPELAAAPAAWYLLCTTKHIKPLLFQQRTAAQFVSQDKPDDAPVFTRKQYVYGVDYRGNAGYAFWQLAYGSTGEG